MSKKKSVVVVEEDNMFEDFDLDDMHYPEDGMSDVMNGMLDASNQQMSIALELTKLIVGNNPTEEQVFSVFKKATQVVGDNFALKKLLEHIG